MFSSEYYYLVAGLRDWTLDADTKGFDARAIIDEISAGVSKRDREAIRLLYAYYDCENSVAAYGSRERYNPLGNLSEEQVQEVLHDGGYSLLPSHMSKVLRSYVANDDEDDEQKPTERFEKALYEAYYADLASSKCRFLNRWGEFDRNLRNVSAALAAREAGRIISEATVGRGDVVEQLGRSSAADFGLRGELPYIDAVIAAVNDEKNIVEKERKIDAVRWSEADEITVFDFFNIDYLLSYLVKVNIVARWSMLSAEVGRQMLDRLIKELDAKELVNKQ